MRQKLSYQELLIMYPSSSVKVVKEYVDKYIRIDSILQENPMILDLAHVDFQAGLGQSIQGRVGAYTTEEIFRSVVVMFLEQWSYRDTVINIDTNVVLQKFVGLGFKPMMDYTFLCKAYCALSVQTWEEINRVLKQYAKEEGLISGAKFRLDSTVYETNIHYPTDSSLLWDSYRTIARLLREIQAEMRQAGLDHRFHTKKVKRLAYYISRNGGSPSKRKQQRVKKTYRCLIRRVQSIVDIAKQAGQALKNQWDLIAVLEELEHYLPLVERVIYQARMRVVEGIQLPPDEKLYSIFEEHTELLIRGKAGKPVEFGHKSVFGQSEEKFITYYQSLPKREEDPELLKEGLAEHKELFQQPPDLVAGDRGFYKDINQIKKLEEEIPTVSIAKKGARTAEEKARESTEEFKEGQRFRAGCEGSISVLKRGFKLKRCLFKGFKNYAASVGCAVFCHNLVILAGL